MYTESAMRCLRCCLPPNKRRYVVDITGLKHIDICLSFNPRVMPLPRSFAPLSLLFSLLLTGWLSYRSHLPCVALTVTTLRLIVFMCSNVLSSGVNIAIARATQLGSKLCPASVSSPGLRPHCFDPSLPLLEYQHCHENENQGVLIMYVILSTQRMV